jgi:hypothetical protein
MFKPVGDLGQWLFKMTFQAHSTGTSLWKSFNEWFHTPGVSADMENFAKQFGRIGSVFGLYTSFKSQWDADQGRRMGTEERVTRSLFRTAMDFGGSTAGAAVGGFAGGAAGLLGGPAAPVTVPLGAVGGGLVGGAAVGNAMHHVGDILIDPVGRGMRNLSELSRRQPGLFGGPTT